MSKGSMMKKLMVFAMMVLISGGLVSAEVITIMAANTSSGNNQSYESPGIRIFQGLNPDVVLIQEFNYLSGSLRDFVDEAFGADYDYYVEGGGESIPNGIISRFPIIDSGEWNDPSVSDRDFAWAVIDIPGNKNLQVVSVHLKASSSSASIRASQANILKNYIESNFFADEYIVVGGDLNTYSTTETALNTFNTFLSASNHRPSDQEGNRNTNAGRNHPYDWVMPNGQLDQYHIPLVIGSSVYSNGLVFDSRVYTPLSEVSPVQYNDSDVSGMQHMAVMKAFDVDVTGPTNTPSPTPSNTPTPTYTPTMGFTSTPTPTPTATPTADPSGSPYPTLTPTPTVTPTPDPEFPIVELTLNQEIYHGGDSFILDLEVLNNAQQHTLGLFIILAVYDDYFFAPDWGTEVDWDNLLLRPGTQVSRNIFDFQWPNNAGTAMDLYFYAALADPGDFSLVSNLSAVKFGFEN